MTIRMTASTRESDGRSAIAEAEASRPGTVADILSAWAERRIDTATAISRGQFEGFADLLETAADSDLEIDMTMTDAEKRQAAFLTEIMASALGDKLKP